MITLAIGLNHDESKCPPVKLGSTATSSKQLAVVRNGSHATGELGGQHEDKTKKIRVSPYIAVLPLPVRTIFRVHGR